MNSTLSEYLKAWRDGLVPAPPITVLIGARLAQYGDGWAEVELDADERRHNPFGAVQGGLLCTLAGVAMGAAAATTLKKGERFSTTNLDAQFCRPVTAGLLCARAQVFFRGRTTVHVTCEIYAGDQLVARLSSTCLVKQGPSC